MTKILMLSAVSLLALGAASAMAQVAPGGGGGGSGSGGGVPPVGGGGAGTGGNGSNAVYNEYTFPVVISYSGPQTDLSPNQFEVTSTLHNGSVVSCTIPNCIGSTGPGYGTPSTIMANFNNMQKSPNYVSGATDVLASSCWFTGVKQDYPQAGTATNEYMCPQKTLYPGKS